MQHFSKLLVWRRAHEVCLQVYRETTSMPADERFGLTAQLRSSAASIGANIAEGCGRPGDGEFTRFLGIAMGSASGLEYHLLLARDVGFLPASRWARLNEGVSEVRRLLLGLLRRVRSRPA